MLPNKQPVSTERASITSCERAACSPAPFFGMFSDRGRSGMNMTTASYEKTTNSWTHDTKTENTTWPLKKILNNRRIETNRHLVHGSLLCWEALGGGARHSYRLQLYDFYSNIIGYQHVHIH